MEENLVVGGGCDGGEVNEIREIEGEENRDWVVMSGHRGGRYGCRCRGH